MNPLFRGNALFGGLSADAVSQLDLPIEERHLEDGEMLFEEGTEGRWLYLVGKGEIKISKRGRGGRQETLGIKKRGEFFGEMALLLDDDHLRTARATARGTTVLGRIDSQGLDTLLGFSPLAARHFTGLIASQLRSATDLFIKELINAERLSLIGTMMGAMVHDFRNPIATITMVSHYLCSQEDDDRMVELGNLTAEATDQMLVMIQELLDYSKGEVKLDRAPTPVDELLEAAELQMRSTLDMSGITVERQISFDGEIFADRNRLIRLFCNIIKNACEAMRDGGALTIIARRKDDDAIFEFRDTGVGMPPEVLERIFEPFVTHGKTDGTGLGMAIAKSVVKAHKGKIRIESELGQGTTCRIRLPIARPA